MFSICPQKVFANKNLKDIDLRVYLTLQKFSNEDGYCYPSIMKMADICGVSRRTVERSLARLEEQKAIARQKRIKNDGGYTSNGYYLKLDAEYDATDMSQGIRQECRKGYDKNDASNYNQYNNNNFNLNNTRVCTREEISKRDCVLGLEDINDVKYCLENVSVASDYNFYLNKQGELFCRPKAKYINQDKNCLIYDFFFYKCGREIKFHDFDTHEIGELLINI